VVPSLPELRVLCLAAGGGQQAPDPRCERHQVAEFEVFAGADCLPVLLYARRKALAIAGVRGVW
jgi:hypothetical protein